MRHEPHGVGHAPVARVAATAAGTPALTLKYASRCEARNSGVRSRQTPRDAPRVDLQNGLPKDSMAAATAPGSLPGLAYCQRDEGLGRGNRTGYSLVWPRLVLLRHGRRNCVETPQLDHRHEMHEGRGNHVGYPIWPV